MLQPLNFHSGTMNAEKSPKAAKEIGQMLEVNGGLPKPSFYHNETHCILQSLMMINLDSSNDDIYYKFLEQSGSKYTLDLLIWSLSTNCISFRENVPFFLRDANFTPFSYLQISIKVTPNFL